MIKIIKEINWCASIVINKVSRKTNGGLDWTPLGHEFRAFLAINLYMGMKLLPNIQCYWGKSEVLFHYPIISKIMTRDCFEDISQCLYVTRTSYVVQGVEGRTGDKIEKVK